MTGRRHREIVIEFEKVQTIRKRARTMLIACDRCGAGTDAVSLIEASQLFEITRDDMFRFIEQNNCHYQSNGNGKIYLCVTSLLECMQIKNNIRRLIAKGEVEQ